MPKVDSYSFTTAVELLMRRILPQFFMFWFAFHLKFYQQWKSHRGKKSYWICLQILWKPFELITEKYSYVRIH